MIIMDKDKIENELYGKKECISCNKLLVDKKNWSKIDRYRICNNCISKYIDSLRKK